MRQETCDRRCETVDVRQETCDRKEETGEVRQETGTIIVVNKLMGENVLNNKISCPIF